MSQWYLSYDGEQAGPFDISQARARAGSNSEGYCWREGFTEWLPIRQVAELSQSGKPSNAPPPLTARTTDEIDFQIMGTEMQFVEVELDPGESAVAEAGAMMYKDTSIQMQAVFGDGSQSEGGKFMDKLLGAGKRLLTNATSIFRAFGQRNFTLIDMPPRTEVALFREHCSDKRSNAL